MEQVHEGWHPAVMPNYSSFFFFWLLFLILKIVWVYFPAPVAIQINAGETNQRGAFLFWKEVFQLLFDPSLLSQLGLAFSSYPSLELDYSVTAVPGFALPSEGWFFFNPFHLIAVQRCPEEPFFLFRWRLWGCCVCLGVGHGAVWSLRAALQEVTATCSAPQTLEVFARVSARATAALAAPKAWDLGLICAFTANPVHLQSSGFPAWPRAAVLSSASICAQEISGWK